jgi:hypothetical protein
VSASLAHRILAASPAVEDVNFAYCDWATDASLALCVQRCPLLESVTLIGCTTQFTSAGVVHAIELSNKNLRRLDLLGCVQLGDEVVLAVAQYCPLLEAFSSPPNVGDVLAELAEGCPRLASVGLVMVNITDAVLIALATHCKELSSVNVTGCTKITMLGIRALAEQWVLRSLRIFQNWK